MLFDAGNTLLWLDHARIADVLTAVGIPCTAEQVRDAEFAARPLLDPHLGRAPKRETPHVYGLYMDLLLDHLHVDPAAPSRAAAHRAVHSIWRELWVRPPPDAHSTVRALSGRGYRVGVVSNSDGKVDALLDGCGFGGLFGCVVDSGTEGVEKPDPRIFHLAAQRLGVQPAQCVYVGDFASLDVHGARAAGMEGILFDPGGVWTAPDLPRIAALSELLDHFPAPAA